ncbi:MAG: efflux transporter periplasmic adaptor subunit [Bacteroidetes bacterium 43-16]|nr:MAG: efflux transporter periplasmic adaptor subunit [Bacteroidetes bacterium 43-16]
MQKSILWVSAIALLTYSSCTSHKEEHEEHIKYEVTSPITMDTSVTKEYVAQIRSIQNIEIRAQEKGYLQKMFVDEGQAVKKGQLLFKIMPNLTEAEADKARAEVKAAEVELQNTQMLADKNIVSKNELAVAKAKLQQARAGLNLANTHLGFTDIRAPFDGILNRIPKKLGSLIDEGELLTSLSDNSQMFVYFNVSEPEYLNYMLHKDNDQFKEVRLMMANNQEFPAKGFVETVEGEFNPETGNIAFRAKFPNADRILKNGETGKIMMTTPLVNAIVIPQKATYEIQDKKYVFVVGNDGKAVSKNVKVIAELPNLYVIAGDLSVNDKILLEGVQTIKENEKIKFTFIQPKEAIAKLALKAE